METIQERRADALELQRMQEGMEEGRAVRVTPAPPQAGSMSEATPPTTLPE